MSVPIVRISDAALTPDDGPARVVVAGLSSPESVVDALASAGSRAHVRHGRLEVVTTPSRLVDATGRASGRPHAEALERVLDAAVAAWHAPPPSVQVGSDRVPVGGVAVMGVLNVTPDSFSDGGLHDGDPQAAVEHGLRLAEEGAAIVDVGGESTRPGAGSVPTDEQIDRVVPVVRGLAEAGVNVSVDTTDAAVARAAVEAGAGMVNDVSAGLGDPEMLPTVAGLGVAYVAMHMRGEPATMQDDPRYDDVVGDVFDHLARAVRRAAVAGLAPERVVVDPGIGFGKTLEHNLALLRGLRDLTSLGRPLLVGASRKSFIGRLTGVEEPSARLHGSVAAAVVAASRGAGILRVHDVAETAEAVRVADAITAS